MARARSRRPTSPPERTRLRRYAPGDFRAVARLWRRSGLHLGPSDRSVELERARRRDPDLFLVAVRGTSVVGAILGRFDGRRGWVNHLAVDPSARSRGIATRLMAEVERRLRAKGCQKVNLHVVAANREVCRFYEGLGYERTDLIFMGKWLRR